VTAAPNRGVLLAVMLALLLHAGLLLLTVRPVDVRRMGLRVPPNTRFLAEPVESMVMNAADVRTIRSPVVFSLPSSMGFSRELLSQDVQTRLRFSQQMETERFLNVDAAAYVNRRITGLPEVAPLALKPLDPAVPADIYQESGTVSTARRVTMDTMLKSRIEGSVVLPPALNQSVEKPWEVRAAIHVTESGMVQHVLLEQPLDSAELNQQVIQLLYGLRFKAGRPLDGSVEIYSPESVLPEVEEP